MPAQGRPGGMGVVGELGITPHATPRPIFLSLQLQPLDEAVLQQKPSVNAVTTLEKVIEIQSAWGQAEGLTPPPARIGNRVPGLAGPSGPVCSP